MADHPLTAYRKRHNLTLDEFAQRLQAGRDDGAAVHKGMVHRWENGTIPRPKFMALIHDATSGEVTANDFFQPRTSQEDAA